MCKVFEPNFTKVVSSVRKNIGITQSVVELKLPTNENDIKKVYSVNARSTIKESQLNGREVVFGGLVDIQAIYESEIISAIDYSVEFKDRLMIDEELDGDLIVTSNVLDVSSSIVSGGIRVVVIVETNIDLIESRDMNILKSVNGEGSHVSTNTLSYLEYVGRAYETIDVTQDFQIDGVTNVLMVTPCVSLQNVECRDNYLVVSGKVNVDVCYKTGDGIKDIGTKKYEIDFNSEVALEGITNNSNVQSLVSILYNEIKTSINTEDGYVVVNMYIPLVYSGFVFNDRIIEIVEDLYLESNYLSVTCENIDSLAANTSVRFKDNVSGTASIMDTAPFIDEILGVCSSNLVVVNTRVDNNMLILEGVANSTVLYYTKDTNELTSVQVEMPFAVEEKVDGVNSNIVTICLDNISARSKRGKEIEVSAELRVYSDMYSNTQNMVITQVVLGEEKIPEECSLFIYIVKPNQTLWQVAKEVNVSQELLLEQNPDVELPIKSGDKLVVYKPNLMRF